MISFNAIFHKTAMSKGSKRGGKSNTAERTASPNVEKLSPTPSPTPSPTQRKEVMPTTFKTHYVVKSPNEMVVVVGSLPEIGAWNSKSALKMVPDTTCTWEGKAMLPSSGEFEWKFAILDKNTNEIIRWENGSNRKNPSNQGTLEFNWND